jgi:hypothetical protein
VKKEKIKGVKSQASKNASHAFNDDDCINDYQVFYPEQEKCLRGKKKNKRIKPVHKSWNY